MGGKVTPLVIAVSEVKVMFAPEAENLIPANSNGMLGKSEIVSAVGLQ
jgi:hypothetical protein